jgi:heavy metal sensor kinase
MFLSVFAVLIYTLLADKIEANMKKSLIFGVQQSQQNFFDQNGNFHLHAKANEHHELMHFIAIYIYDVHGKLLYSSHDEPSYPVPENPACFKKFKATDDGRYFYYTELFSKSAEKRYIIQAFYFQQNEKKDLQFLRHILSVLIALSLIACVAGGWYFASRLLAPFRRIAGEASRISVENLGERLAYEVSDDEVGRLCITLNDLFARLHASFEILKRFTSDASHELKTPLTIMRGDIEVLLRKNRSPEEYQETLRYTIKEIDRIIRLSKGLLLLAQAEDKKITIEKEPVLLDEIIREVIDHRTCICNNSKKLLITTDIAQHVCVYGNKDWLQQIVENLFINALQYTPDIGKIQIVLNCDSQYAKFLINNTGHGIPPEHLPHIFTRFYRIDQGRTRKQGGFGLGLAICKALAEAHHGMMEVSSNPGISTTFSLLLPLPSFVSKP